MPPPFRRACNNCVNAKRRCDLIVPRCYRCRVRSLDCNYQKTSLSAAPRQQPAFLTGAARELELSVISRNETPDGDVPVQAMCDGGPTVDFNQLEASLPPFPDYDLDWPDTMENIESYWVPDQINSNEVQSKSVLAGEIYQGRIIYAVKRIKAYPSLLVRHGSTPFVHKKVYAEYLPPAIQDALGICALYGQKTEQNQTLIFQTIRLKAAQLVAGYTPQGLSAIEQLASTQALILYQIIRLFDGDIRLRADAEREDVILNEWTQHLKARMQHVNSTSKDDDRALSTATSWESWVFTESLRRTVIVSFSVQGLYCFLKNGWDDSHHEINCLSFYAQAALWDAPSEYYWRAAMKDCNALPVKFDNWDADMKAATPDDMDDLGMTMMVLIKGVDECCQWMGSKNLEKFGLTLHESQ
jgi:hypothetical protein